MEQRHEMTETFSADEPGKLLSDLCKLVAERAPQEKDIPAAFQARTEDIEQHYRDARKEADEHYQAEKAAIEAEHAAIRSRLGEQFETDHRAAQKEYDEVRAAVAERFETDENSARQQLQESRWEASTISEAARSGSGIELKEIKERLDAQWEELLAIHEEAVEQLQRRWQWRQYPDPQPAGLPLDCDAIRFVAESVARAKHLLHGLSNQSIPALFEGIQPLGFFVLFWLAVMIPCGFGLGWGNWLWVPLSGLGAILLTAAIGGWLLHFSRRQSGKAYTELRRIMADANLARPLALEEAQASCDRQNAQIVEHRDRELRTADEKFAGTMAELRLRRETELWRADEKYPALLAEITARRDRDLQQADENRALRVGELQRSLDEQLQELDRQHSQTMLESDRQYQQQWKRMAEQWRTGIQRFQAAVDRINRACDDRFPDWHTSDWDRWTVSGEIPPVMRFGVYPAKLSRIEHGIPEHEDLQPAPTEFQIPALLPFPGRSLLMLKADGYGRAAAVEIIQAVMLRMLTAMPPGKVRFTIIDPVGLGENFSAFMHLADYDEKLVASRIWTDNAHIEQRLGDLTEHMENVIQVYLRNEFGTIQQYNEFAGEMAEPYRVLVVANFPANFTEAAAQRFKSIVASGARCGVFTLLSVDTKLKLPRQFDLSDLEMYALPLPWDSEHFVWEHPDFGKLQLDFTAPPPAERFTEIVRDVGRRVRDTARVEVPFECAAPEEDQWWTADSRAGIDVPLGRAGAMKLQQLSLGKGTSQHVLVSGKTGSGKSSMLHALITNLALRYGPDELDLYLVDFKKGVEFKAYAASELPHARVIAIESEREFGLSVLQRLDDELKARGDRFRNLGVQDLNGFRNAEAEVVLPRVLLIIDEFQELFVEDDRIAQDAALLLDRLVRQGRAFGIHVLLGSQTLAGAYSLARSTIGQMAVRIALQCSEADAHLILSEDNTAARLLTRPGEAIYNDANGLYEGNHPFQVVWLPDFKRDEYLRRVLELTRRRNLHVRPSIVFEGNVPADAGRNPLLSNLLDSPSWPEADSAVKAWLGSAVAIKDPTAATFVRQSGSNLLMVGHREEEALGVLATCLIGLAAQQAPAETDIGPQFIVLDGTRPDAPEAGFWNRLAPVVPHGVKIVAPRELPGAMTQLTEELARRQSSDDEGAPPLYLIAYNLGRFRDLRKAEDDFSFSSAGEDKPPDPSRQFLDILREGPALGIHTLIWCDTYNNVVRSLDRQSLREVEIRAVFHISATDSSNLIDSPIASKLGVHRALLYDEGQGLVEKFRPYGLPAEDWLAHVKDRLHGRG